MPSARVRRGPLALLAALLVGFTVTARAAEPSSVIVVFDGSGSMWGAMEGARQSKLALARDGLRRALGRLDPATRVGLAGFGHRRGDCGDVEVMLAPEPLDVDRIMAPLGPYNPRGRGPLTTALREAGRALLEAPGRRTLLLIHDDGDNCNQDVCAAAEELKAAGVVVHVVGLAVKPNDVPRMACLPQITGGRQFSVPSADQVAGAIEEAVLLAGAESRPGAPRPVAHAPGAPAAPAIAAGSPAGLYLRALLAPNNEPVSLSLHWTVTRQDGTGVPLFDARSVNPYVPVPPGRYVVEARDGAVSARQTVEAGADAPTPVPVLLNAGTLTVRALAARTNAPQADAVVTFIDAGQSADTRPELAGGAPVAVFKGSEGSVLLPAGRYLVRADQGLVRVERPVVVPAGSQGRLDLLLNGARLQLSAAVRDDYGLLDPPLFSVLEDDPDAPTGRREIARSAARQVEFVLPPGTYYVVARQGAVEARERLALGPGDVARRALMAAAGRLAISSRLAGSAQPVSEPIVYNVQRIDAPGELVSTSRPAPVLLLPGGRYRVEGRYGLMNARTVAEVDIKAGQTQRVVLEYRTALLKLRLVGARGSPLHDVFWEIRDPAGASVWTTGQSEPSLVLQAGSYRIRADTADKRYEHAVELRAGDAQLVELTAD